MIKSRIREDEIEEVKKFLVYIFSKNNYNISLDV